MRWERQIEEAKQEGQIWEVVNKERKRRKEVNREIGMDEWKYFRGLLGGVEGRVLLGEVKVERMADKRGKKRRKLILIRNEEGKGQKSDGKRRDSE